MYVCIIWFILKYYSRRYKLHDICINIYCYLTGHEAFTLNEVYNLLYVCKKKMLRGSDSCFACAFFPPISNHLTMSQCQVSSVHDGEILAAICNHIFIANVLSLKHFPAGNIQRSG